jgi:Tol biopolymer transport system component
MITGARRATLLGVLIASFVLLAPWVPVEASPAGADPPFLTSGQRSPTSAPDWPVRGHLSFTRTTDNDVQSIYAASGRAERQITPPGAYCCLLRISPDHRRLLTIPGGDIPLPLTGGTIDLNGGHYHRLALTDPTLNLIPQAWSPDGTRIAYEGWDDNTDDRTGVYTARLSDGGGLTRVTTRPGAAHDIPLDYSPDGKQLVFYRSAQDDPDSQVGGSLWVVDVDGTRAHRVAGPSDRPAPWARWSPDGRRILFANERTSPTGALWTVPPRGCPSRRLYSDPGGGFPLDPTWSPDGSHIAFALDPTNDEFTHPANTLYVITAHGAHPRLVNATHDFKRQLEWW